MTASLHITPSRATSSNGLNLDGAKWYFYQTGTTTPQSVYTTAALSTPHSNPVEADAAGKFPNIFFDASLSYRGVLKTADDVTTIYDIDPINTDTLSQLAAVGGSALVTFLQAGTGAVARTAQAKMRDIVSVKDFGAVGDGATDDTAAILAARNAVATSGAKLVWPAGTYNYTSSPNWAIQDLEMEAMGDVILNYTAATGNAFIVNADAAGATGPISGLVYNVKILGQFKIQSTATAGVPVLIQSIHHSNIMLRVMGGNPALSGCEIKFSVLSEYEINVSGNPEGVWIGGQPARGLTLTRRNSGEDVAYCVFNNLKLEGLPIGGYLDYALGNLFIGGAMEGCTNIGLDMTANAYNNKFIGTDFEVNTTYDIRCAGRENTFVSNDTEDLIYITGDNNTILGGAHQSITIASGECNLISGVRFDRFRLGTGVITDNGTRTRFRDNLNMNTGKTFNKGLTETAITVTGSPFSYVNSSGNNVRVLVTGGTVSAIDYAPQNVIGRLTGQTSGIFTLRPGDALIVTYAVAPSMYLYVD